MVKDHHIAYHLEIHEDRWKEWKEEKSSELDLNSMAEFIRIYVEAGRRYFSHSHPFPNGNRRSMEQSVKDILREDEDAFTSWGQLREELMEELEQELEESLKNLEKANKIEYSPRNGGYTTNDRE